MTRLPPEAPRHRHRDAAGRVDGRLRRAGGAAGRSGAADARHERHARGAGRAARADGPRPAACLALPRLDRRHADARFRPLLHLSVPVIDLVASASSCRCRWRCSRCSCRRAIAIPVGIFSAERRGRAGDTLTMGVAQLGVAVPNFWFALILVYIFAVWLRLVPAGGFPGWSAGVWPALQGADPAGDRAGAAAGGDPRPRHALGAARSAGRGLHPHRPRQGPAAPRRCCGGTRCATR